MPERKTSSTGNNSTLTAPVSELQDILNLSNREIAIRLQSLSMTINEYGCISGWDKNKIHDMY